MDQAVTADPVGSIQVRRRIKMYKGLLGPEAPVYGDHVELTKIQFTKEHEWDIGEDFASTIGAGGVVGTKFVWPQRDPKYKDVILTPEKDRLWKKWLAIYQSKLLSRGEFLDLYVYGYDKPEAYAIAKDGKMYYAFFNSESHRFSGPVELRGLRAGKYKIFDYVNNRNLGTVTAKDDRLQVSFADCLLVEATPLGGH
jgi:alpha-galactosidase